MRIGFDGLSITARPAGVGGVARDLLAALAARAGDASVVAVLPRGAPEFDGVDVVRAPVDAPYAPRALLYQHLSMGRALAHAGADVHLGPAFVLPRFHLRVPAAVIVYDAAWRRFPDSKSRRLRAYLDRVVPASIRRADAVLTLSRFAAGEIRELVPEIADGKLHVIAPGVPARPVPADPDAALARLGIRPPFLLSVSNFDPRKNLPALVAAWRALRRDHGLPHALVLAGHAERAAALRGDVAATPDEPLITPGYVSDEDLGALYARTDLVVVPSVYEGFGLPVVEAFAAGAPVACSAAGSLGEVAADGALTFDPQAEGAIANAIRASLDDAAARTARVARGRELAAAHDWDRTAAAVLAILRAL